MVTMYAEEKNVSNLTNLITPYFKYKQNKPCWSFPHFYSYSNFFKAKILLRIFVSKM